jgi:phage baseplate assembly protein W
MQIEGGSPVSQLEVTATDAPIQFLPGSEREEIAQNVRMILATAKGTVPFDRNFGLDWAMVDQPVGLLEARISAEVIKQIRRYEPRASVVSVTFEKTSNLADGIIRPKVVIEVNE